jgi:hypothetical protein
MGKSELVFVFVFFVDQLLLQVLNYIELRSILQCRELRELTLGAGTTESMVSSFYARASNI